MCLHKLDISCYVGRDSKISRSANSHDDWQVGVVFPHPTSSLCDRIRRRSESVARPRTSIPRVPRPRSIMHSTGMQAPVDPRCPCLASPTVHRSSARHHARPRDAVPSAPEGTVTVHADATPRYEETRRFHTRFHFLWRMS